MMNPRLAHRGLAFILSAALSVVAADALAEVRTLETAHGPVTLDGDVERVVTLYEGALDSAYAVGVKPLGAIVTRGGTDVANYMQSRVEHIEIVGTPGETNLEAVVALQPDVILASPYLSEEQFNLLSQVAPTLAPEVPRFEPDNWRKEARFFAAALGKQDEMEHVLADIEARTTEVAKRVSEKVPSNQRQAILARWMPQGPMIMATGLFSTGILTAAGFEVQDADVVKQGRPHSSPLSQENLNLMDSDWLFMATLNPEGRNALSAAESSPAYQRLDVVERGHVIPVDGQLWTSASGPIAAQAVLDDIEKTIETATD